MTLTPAGGGTARDDRPAASGESGPIAGRWRPPILMGFLCFLMTALPTYVVVPGPLKSNGSPTRIIAVVLFLLVGLTFLLARRQFTPRHINPGVVILLLYLSLRLATYGVGLIGPEGHLNAANRTRALIGLITHLGVALYVFMRVRTGRDRDFILGCILTGLAFACLVGILQATTSIDLRFFFRPPGFVLNTDDLELAERGGVLRVTGTSQHAIEFSVLAAASVPLAIYYARNAARKSSRVFAGVACLLALVALPASVSRTGIISIAVSMLFFMFVFKVRAIANSLLIVTVSIVAYLAAFPSIVNALWGTVIGSAEDTSITARTADYAQVTAIFRAHPFFGLGLGGQPNLLDNEWLQAVVQGGLVGLVAMVVLMVGAFFGISAALRCATSQREREQAYAIGAVVIAIAASSTTFDLFYYQQVTFFFFIAYALLWSRFTVSFPETHRGADTERRGVT